MWKTKDRTQSAEKRKKWDQIIVLNFKNVIAWSYLGFYKFLNDNCSHSDTNTEKKKKKKAKQKSAVRDQSRQFGILSVKLGQTAKNIEKDAEQARASSSTYGSHCEWICDSSTFSSSSHYCCRAACAPIALMQPLRSALSKAIHIVSHRGSLIAGNVSIAVNFRQQNAPVSCTPQQVVQCCRIKSLNLVHSTKNFSLVLLQETGIFLELLRQ